MSLDLSIVIPIFGNFDTQRLSPVIDAIKRQENISFEIIISEQGNTSLQNTFTKDPLIKYVSSSEQKKGVYNAGAARNIGLKIAQGKYVYFNDADIIFLNKNYLNKLIQNIKENHFFIRPDMYRILKEEVPLFLNQHKTKGIEMTLAQLFFKENYLATFNRNHEGLKLITFNNKLFSSTPELLNKYTSNKYLHGKENLIWQRLVHCGATFGTKEDLESVGGYSHNYPICVYEDSDLQWKLREKYEVLEINGGKGYEVLHLDHDLGYRSTAQEMGNREMFNKRKIQGVNKSIQEDLNCYKRLN